MLHIPRELIVIQVWDRWETYSSLAQDETLVLDVVPVQQLYMGVCEPTQAKRIAVGRSGWTHIERCSIHMN